MLMFNKFRQRGVTLFELLLVLFVAAFVAVAVATIYNRVNTTYKQNVLFNDMQELAGNIRSLYGASTTGYTGLSNTVVLNAAIAPPSMLDSSGKEINAFATEDGWEVGVPSSTTTQFFITMNGLPSGACTSLGSKGLGVAQAVATSADGGALTDVGAIAGACNGKGNTNSITLIYT
jgi:Tfp pilus assembly protein PilW